MSSYMEPVCKFESNGVGYIGYNFEGDIVAGGFEEIDEFYVLQGAVGEIQNPEEFLRLTPLAMSGDKTAIGYHDGGNDQGLAITATGFLATLDLSIDSYEVEMTFDEFLPILKDWEDAWAAAQDFKKTLSS